MPDINSNDGLPDDLDPMDQLARAEQNITVKLDSRTYNKEMTVVEGFGDDVELDDLSSRLKSQLACGGTVKDGHIELQGDHLRRIKDVLVDEGFDESNIEVKR
jgi:translation initiation factor 1